MRAATSKWLRRAAMFRDLGGQHTPKGRQYLARFRRIRKFDDAVKAAGKA